MSQPDFDVIVIGRRCAGASLAIGLAQQNLRTLVVDRATFPSLPAVASSPVIFDGSMKMLNELGLSEDDYSLPGSRADHFVLNFVKENKLLIKMPFSCLDTGVGHNIYGPA